MATIYDDIPIIVDPNEANVTDKFVGCKKIVSETNKYERETQHQLILKQQDWMLTTVEEAILKAAQNGKWSVSIPVPTEYNFYDCQQFLINAGYGVRSQGNRLILISWDEKLPVYRYLKLYEDTSLQDETEIQLTEVVTAVRYTKVDENFIKSVFPSTYAFEGQIYELNINTMIFDPNRYVDGEALYIAANYIKKTN